VRPEVALFKREVRPGCGQGAARVRPEVALFKREVRPGCGQGAARVRPEVALFALCRRVYVAVTEIEHRCPTALLR